ncbi:hypothetical protein [Mucilaginibacter sp.]|uniref:hypothetical protein n=1 Tax=Mucilaginibacter sp. TaxID=1882438 RepID=UPI0028499726|nr:hypothetical protein [Mucilaginibacter sp.]MDR3695507.1 hypothetical protein [Mucilaginibacter sp.]
MKENTMKKLLSLLLVLLSFPSQQGLSQRTLRCVGHPGTQGPFQETLLRHNKEVILELFGKFEQACYNYEGIEFWSARELQEILGYQRWENFANAISKAKKACENAG